MTYRILVTGSRHYQDRNTVLDALVSAARAAPDFNVTVILH